MTTNRRLLRVKYHSLNKYHIFVAGFQNYIYSHILLKKYQNKVINLRIIK